MAGAKYLCAPVLALLALCLIPHEARAQEALWKTYLEVGEKAQEREDFPEAERCYKLALAKAEQFGPNDYRVALTLSKLIYGYFKAKEDDKDKRADEAKSFYERAVAIWEKTAGPNPLEMAVTIETVAELYRWKEGNGESLLKRALAIRRANSKPDDIILALDSFKLSLLYYERGKYAEAETFSQESLGVIERNPRWGQEHDDYMTVLTGLARIMVKLKRDDDAENIYKRILNALIDTRGLEHPMVAKHLDEMLTFYKEHGRNDAAVGILKQQIEVSEKTYKADHETVIRRQRDLVRFYEGHKLIGDAVAEFDRVIKFRAGALGEDHPFVAKGWHDLAEMYFRLGESDKTLFEKAIDVYGRSLAVTEKRRGAEAESYAANLHLRIGDAQEKMERHDEAEASYKRAVDMYAKLPDDWVGLCGTRQRLAEFYKSNGRYTEAEEELKKNIELLNQKAKASAGAESTYRQWEVSRLLVQTYTTYAEVLRKMGRTAEAQKAEARVKELSPRSPIR